tara:strand:+ start:602 stop:1153 length:552 start_codon:yes stop_codon:yes gene_type:complete
MEVKTLQRLDLYKINRKDHPGGSFLLRALWVLLARPIVSSHIPGTIWRKFILRLFGAEIGIGGRIKPNLKVTFPWKLKIGNHCWLGEYLWIDNLAEVKIGNQVCISQGAFLCTGNHNYKSNLFDLSLGPIEIEDHAWIAAKCIIAPGTLIGEGTIVTLGTVISGKVPPGMIVKGNPAEIISKR